MTDTPTEESRRIINTVRNLVGRHCNHYDHLMQVAAKVESSAGAGYTIGYRKCAENILAELDVLENIL